MYRVSLFFQIFKIIYLFLDVFLVYFFQNAISRIEQKMPEIDRVINEVDQLCQEPYMDEEDRVALLGKLKDLNTNWDEMRAEALQKEAE